MLTAAENQRGSTFMDSVEMHLRSQGGQDRFIYENLLSFPGGVYFEAGALEGEHISNTYFFDRALGWTGILVEMQQHFIPTIRTKRPNAKIFPCGLGREDAKLLYLDAGDRSSLLRHIDRRSVMHLEHHYRNIEPKPEYRVLWIDVRPLMSVIEEAGVSHIDYFSLDVEGAEIEVLESVDFSRVTVDLFTVEDQDLQWLRHQAILEPQGYSFLGSIEGDGIFAHDRLVKRLEAEHGLDYIAGVRQKLAQTGPIS
jgi:hypothetical protein